MALSWTAPHNPASLPASIRMYPLGTTTWTIGARLIATAGDLRQTREILGGLGYCQDEMVAHFGLESINLNGELHGTFNLAGQRVVTLIDGMQNAGTYTVRWDGRDDGGRKLASGVYLYRLHTGDGRRIETRKLVLAQ